MLWSTALFVVCRVVVLVVADTPAITPDEFGSWAIAAQLIGDDAAISMRDMPRYSLLSGAVIAPVQALGLEPAVAYKVAILWLSGASLGAAALARRSVGLLRPGRPVVAATVYALVLLFPATLGTSLFTWAEPVVLLWWGVLAWSTARGLVGGGTAAVVIGSVAAGLGPVVHGRLIAAPVIWATAWVAVAVLQRRSGRTAVVTALGAAALTLVVAAGSSALEARVVAEVWDGTPTGRPRLGLADISWWTGAALSAVARLWYLIGASLGLAAVGAVALARSVRRTVGRERVAAVTISAMLAANLAIATVFGARSMSDLDRVGRFGGLRWDHVVYGRYIDGAVLVLAAVGLVAATQWARRSSASALLVAAGLLAAASGTILWWVDGHELAPTIEVMVGGLSWIPGPAGQPGAILWWSLVALAATCTAALAARRGPRMLILVALTWTVCGAILSTSSAWDWHRQFIPAPLAAELGAPDDVGAELVVASDVESLPHWRLGVFARQRELGHIGWRIRFAEDDSAALGARQGDDAGAAGLVLVDGVEPDGSWDPGAQHGGATVWRPGAG